MAREKILWVIIFIIYFHNSSEAQMILKLWIYYVDATKALRETAKEIGFSTDADKRKQWAY